MKKSENGNTVWLPYWFPVVCQPLKHSHDKNVDMLLEWPEESIYICLAWAPSSALSGAGPVVLFNAPEGTGGGAGRHATHARVLHCSMCLVLAWLAGRSTARADGRGDHVVIVVVAQCNWDFVVWRHTSTTMKLP